ncbi:hypothetical protein [Erythrobacter sp. Alg231-14]|uniref:hypothetical protein n=1 Tax=Erythrobacter sp. Alg231-14 TaxID=1922225 RepID=UPI00307C34CD
MTIANIALIAAFVMVAWVVVDWRRGKTALGRHRLTKEDTPDKYWMAIVLYLNMAFALLWLQGRVPVEEAVPVCPNGEATCVLVDVGQAV